MQEPFPIIPKFACGEPTGALDSKSGAQIMELFQSLHEEGVTIIMITHDSEIASHAQRVIHIRDGQIAEQ